MEEKVFIIQPIISDNYRCVHDDVWFMEGWHQTEGFMDVKQVLYHPSHIPSAIRY